MSVLTYKKILIITCEEIPHPRLGASSILYFQYILSLIKSKHEVIHISIHTNDYFDKKKIDAYKNKLRKYKKFTFRSIKIKKIYKNLRLSYFYKNIETEKLNFQIVKFIKNLNPDKIIAFDITAASIAKNIFSKKVLYVWLGDLKYVTYFYHFLYDFKENFLKMLYFPFYYIVIQKWKKFYYTVLKNNYVINGSFSNVSELKRIAIKSKYLPYPWPKLSKSKEKKKFIKPSFIFFGNLLGLGSRSGLNFLFDKIYPLFLKEWGHNNFNIYICGRFNFRQHFAQKIININEIKFKGYLKNLNTLADKCHAVIFPINVPVGNRSRIITALSNYWPIVAHSNVTFGNPSLISNKNCFLAKNPNKFFYYCKQLYLNKKLSSYIVNNGFKTYLENFEPSSAVKIFKKEINV